MLWKDKCAGCRKTKYFVKYREAKLGHGIGLVTSTEKLCFWCSRKLKKLTKI